MIRCRICGREHEAGAKTCACGADLAVDGIASGVDARFGDTDLGDSLPSLGDLPELDADSTTFPGETSLTDSLSIPEIDDPPPVIAEPPTRRLAPSTGFPRPRRRPPLPSVVTSR